MFCGTCGSQVNESQNFCPYCGGPLHSPKPSAQEPEAPSSTSQAPVQQGANDAYAQNAAMGAQGESAEQQASYQPVQGQQHPEHPQAVILNGQEYHDPSQQAYQASYESAANPQYKQLGGWLLFIVVMMIVGILGSLSSVGSIAMIGSELPSSFNGYIAASTVVTLVEAAMNVGFVVLVLKRSDFFLKYYQIISIVDIALSIVLTLFLYTLPNGAEMVGSFSASMLSSILGGVGGLVLFTMYFCKSVRVRTYMVSTSYMDKAFFKIGV